MRAYKITAFGKPAEICHAAIPDAAPGQIGVRIRACALNFADLLMQDGSYQDTPPLPFVPGLELAGEVTTIGDGVHQFAVGDRVAVFSGNGGLAEYGAFDAGRAVPIPDAMSFEEAAAFQIAYATSHVALDHLARLRPGETLLVTGAAGGVGLTAVELGKLMGARVIAHARGPEKLDVARKAGADELIDDAEDLRSRVKELGGSDVVYETVGGDVFRSAFRSCRPGGRILTIGFAGGDVPQIPANHLMVKNLSVIGFYIGGYMNAYPEVVADSLKTLLGWWSGGRIRPHISHTLPLERAPDGYELLRTRKSTGKVVITM